MIRRVVLLWLNLVLAKKSLKFIILRPSKFIDTRIRVGITVFLFFYLYCRFFALPILILWIFLKICILFIYDKKKSAPSILKLILGNFFFYLGSFFFQLNGLWPKYKFIMGFNWVIMPISLSSLILSIHLSIYIFHPKPKFAYLLCLKAHLRC